MMDFAKPDRQRLIDNTHPHASLESKRRRAIEYLGTKWVLHRVHAVKRKARP